MSIIQSIRDKAAPVTIGVIAISLIGFILMDAGRSGFGSNVSPKDAVASINGVDISWEKYQSRIKLNEQLYEMNGRSVDDEIRVQINNETWRATVEEELMRQHFDELGIDVTDKEFNDILFGKNPPDFLKQQFTNPRTGEFDAASARQAISELKKSKNAVNRDLVNNVYLDPLLANAKRGKYFALLQNSAYAPKWMGEKTISDNGLMAKVSYLTAPYAEIPDSTVKVTDADIQDYLSRHEAEYKNEEESRSIQYVSFGFMPSSTDTADVLGQLSSLKSEFAASEDPGAFVTRNGSTLPFYDGYSSKNRIQIAQKDSIINAGVGKVYGPYLDVSSYVLSRVVDMKVLPDSVKARHILVSLTDPATQQPKLDDAAARKKIDSIENLVKTGVSFEALAVTLSDDPGSKDKGGDLGYFAGGAMVKEFNDFCFSKKKGDMGVVKTQFGFHLIQITDQKDFSPAYKIAYLAKPIEASQATVNDALIKANAFAASSKDASSFDASVQKGNLVKLVADEIKENDYQVVGLGVNRQFVKDVFQTSVGKLTGEPVEFKDKFVVAMVASKETKGLPTVRKARPLVESMVRNEMKAKLLLAKAGNGSLEEVSKKLNQAVQVADSVSFVSPVLGSSGYELKAGGFGFNKASLNKVSKGFKGTSGVFFVKPENIYAKADAAANVEEMLKTIVSQQKNALLYSSIDAMKKAAAISDKRSKFM